MGAKSKSLIYFVILFRKITLVFFFISVLPVFFWSVFSHIFPLFLELKLNTKQDTVQDRTPLFLFIKYIKIKLRKRKTVNLQMGKMSEAIEVNRLHPLQAKMKQKYSCGKDIKTRKKPKSKEKIEAKHAI